MAAFLKSDGLCGVGKTGARAKFAELREPHVNEPRAISGRPGEYAVMLLTPAHMLDLRNFVEEADGVPRWKMTARQAYKAYWRVALPGAAEPDARALKATFDFGPW